MEAAHKKSLTSVSGGDNYSTEFYLRTPFIYRQGKNCSYEHTAKEVID